MNRRLVNTKQGELEFQEEPIPDAPPTGIVLKVCYVGICNSDTYLCLKQKVYRLGFFPRVRGHEISGVVYSIGGKYATGRGTLRVGDKVVAYPWGGCQKCDYCTAGHYLICPNKDGNDSENYGILSDGGFQQYLKVENPWRLVKLPEDSDMAVSCLAPCSATTGYHAAELCSITIERAIQIKGRANVVCYGAGSLALWMTEIMKTKYGNQVRLCAVDIAPEVFSESHRMVESLDQGNTEEAVSQIQGKFDGQSVDAAVDFVNVPASQERLFNSLAKGGVQVCVGLMANEMAKLNLVSLVIRQVSLHGVVAGTKEHLQQVLSLLKKGKITGPPITLIKLEDVETVLRTMVGGGVYRGRFVVNMCQS